MPDWTIEDRIQFETDRIINFGSDSSVTLYDEAGTAIITIPQFWFIYKKLNYTVNSFQYHLKIAEDDVKYDDEMKAVKTIRYTIDDVLSETYTHNGIEAPDFGGKRTWLISVNKPKFRNNFFTAA
jgi:hypothetical protein